jgi:hypothetical protein
MHRRWDDHRQAEAHQIAVQASRPDPMAGWIQLRQQLLMQHAIGIGLPLAQILPIQMVTIRLAVQSDIEPGKFIRSRKVTLAE